MSEKKKKEKIIYYDDGSTVSDMSEVKGGIVDKTRPKEGGKKRVNSTFGEKMRTYFTTVKMMLVPMFVVLFILALLFLITTLIANAR